MQDRGAGVLLRLGGEAGSEDRIGGVVREAVPAQLREVTDGEIAGAPSGDPGVEGDHDALEAGGLGPFDQALGQLPVGGRVELEQAGSVTELRGDLFHRVHAQC